MKKAELEELFLKGNLNLLPVSFLDAKDSQILSRVQGLMRYWPDEELYPSLLLSLLRCPREFKKVRTIPHLSRLICAEYFFKKKALGSLMRASQRRHLYVKLLPTHLEFPFGSKPVLGMVVVFNLMQKREAFEEQHIIEAVRRIIPDVSVVQGSFLEDQDRRSQLQTAYLEIQRDEPAEFSPREMKRLKEALPEELKECIEQLAPMTFMRRNEEEVYRNVLALRDQLKGVRDLPQMTITYEEQTQFDLFFTVVLVRLISGQMPSVKEAFEQAYPNVIFIPDRVDLVGNIRKTYLKEATVFRLQMPKNSFFRKDRSVNLYKARQHVVSLLTNALGPVRDFNGGLMLKQNERLEDFLSIMASGTDDFELENFFYSITPIAMQSILPATLLKEWFVALSELKEQMFPGDQPYLLVCKKREESLLVITCSEDPSFKEDLLPMIYGLEVPSLELALSETQEDGVHYFGFLYRPSQLGKIDEFSGTVRQTMENWGARKLRRQELRIAIRGSEPCLDPTMTQSDLSYLITRMLYEGLTRRGRDGKPELAIAQSYEVSPDFQTYIFALREAVWSDGTAITAYDFEYSWKRALDPRAHSVFANMFFMIEHAEDAFENRVSIDQVGVHALDAQTLVVKLAHPVPYFLEVTAHWAYALISSHVDQKNPGWAYQAGENYVCNGPFKLLEWKHNQMLMLEKNPSYWDAQAVCLDQITITMVDGSQDELSMYTKGKIDFLGRPMSPFPPEALAASPERFPLMGVYTLWFNTSQFPFTHKKIRQAFAYAVNRDVLRKAVPHEYGCAAHSLVPRALIEHSEPLFPIGDLAAARRLFKEGMGEIGFVKSDFPHLKVSYAAGMYRDTLFKMLCEQWREAFDIDITEEAYEWRTYFDRLTRGDFQIGGMELQAWWNDPVYLLEFFNGKKGRLKLPRWSHSEFISLLDRAKRSLNPLERKELLSKAEAILIEEMPAVPLYELCGHYLKRKEYQELTPSPFFDIDFKWTHKEI